MGIYLELSLLERATGNMVAAVDYARKYQSERPEDIEAHIQLGDLLRDSGELDRARGHYEQAQLLENDPVVPTLRLVVIAARNGDENKARQLLEQAETMARTPTHKGAVRQSAAYLEGRLGRIDAAIVQFFAAEEFLLQTQSPFAVALATYWPMVQLNLRRGDTESAAEALATGKGMLEPPLDKFLAFAETLLLVEMGELEQAEQALGRGIEIIDQLQFDSIRFQVSLCKSEIQGARGDHAAQTVSIKHGLEQIDRSSLAAEIYSQWVPELYAALADAQILSGDLESAEESLARGFKLDPSEPNLWSAKARLQEASGMLQLASASVNYALAIWENADPEFVELQEAKALSTEINAAID